MKKNDVLFTKEKDGTIAKWYVDSWYGPRFSVSAIKNAKLKDCHHYYHMDDLGNIIFFDKNEARNKEA